VARRGTRALLNQPEIEALLHPQGYTTVYPEDLSVDQEIRYFIDAEEIVAIHGAGLAPLIYRAPDTPPSMLLEILPVGHITNFYRAMIADLNGRWAGARGYIEADQVAEIYRLEQPYMMHSLRNFRVDPKSVEAALALLREDAR
jgi:capsular polysaccharide biosynthesis protein